MSNRTLSSQKTIQFRDKRVRNSKFPTRRHLWIAPKMKKMSLFPFKNIEANRKIPRIISINYSFKILKTHLAQMKNTTISSRHSTSQETRYQLHCNFQKIQITSRHKFSVRDEAKASLKMKKTNRTSHLNPLNLCIVGYWENIMN